MTVHRPAPLRPALDAAPESPVVEADQLDGLLIVASFLDNPRPEVRVVGLEDPLAARLAPAA